MGTLWWGLGWCCGWGGDVVVVYGVYVGATPAFLPLNINVAFQFHSILLRCMHSYCVCSFLAETCLLGMYICLKGGGAEASVVQINLLIVRFLGNSSRVFVM